MNGTVPYAADGTRYGNELKCTYFQLGVEYCNLNHGSYGAVPRPVMRSQRELVEEQERYPDAWFRKKFFEYIDIARNYVADYVNAFVDDIVLVENASTAINSILRSGDLRVRIDPYHYFTLLIS